MAKKEKMTWGATFVKWDEDGNRIEIPYEDLTEEQKKEQAKKLTKRFFEALGFTVTEKTAG